MDGNTVLWIVVAAVVVLILLALIAAAAKKAKQRRIEHDRQAAVEHEQKARLSAVHAERQHAAADEVEARSRKAQAIADEKAAEARRLAAGATERREAAEQASSESSEHLTKAQELHPEAQRRDDDDSADRSPHAASWGTDAEHAEGADRHRRDVQGDDGLRRGSPEAAGTAGSPGAPMRGATEDQLSAPGAREELGNRDAGQVGDRDAGGQVGDRDADGRLMDDGRAQHAANDRPVDADPVVDPDGDGRTPRHSSQQ
ncbi:hypothetical protein Kfla_0267 [Kribbella flavida DSM 17836]|uniref:Uncharacterized protein n=1 Tax=Kribbella flavida (strain DSM 17836 / JCM 10339 / NBRC 14399) TaxID=479435 RepID=D2PT75_KRIFD|nr:hypothetical protein [Kribbella flavida]ADB29391.1 hypothetical protein Kfla_0267 [Kribbella flavida DSM 17836]